MNMTDDRYAGRALSLLRIVTALLLLLHGSSKLFGFPPALLPAPDVASLLWFAALIELVGGVLLLVGVFSRPVALILLAETALIYLMSYATRSPYPSVDNGGAAILLCFIFLYIAAAGPGPWSLDAQREADDEPGVEGYAAPGGERQYRPEDFGDKII